MRFHLVGAVDVDEHFGRRVQIDHRDAVLAQALRGRLGTRHRRVEMPRSDANASMKRFAVEPVPTPTMLSLRSRGLIIVIAASAAARLNSSAPVRAGVRVDVIGLPL